MNCCNSLMQDVEQKCLKLSLFPYAKDWVYSNYEIDKSKEITTSKMT